MTETGNWDSALFADAFLAWTGWGRETMPRRNDSLVIARFGAEAASTLLPAIKSLMEQFYRSDARLTAADLASMGEMATREFRARRLEVADEVVKALAWCYTFDFK